MIGFLIAFGVLGVALLVRWLLPPAPLKVSYGDWFLATRCTHCGEVTRKEDVCEKCGTLEPRLDRLAARWRYESRGMESIRHELELQERVAQLEKEASRRC